MATHSSILVWEIPWAEKPGRLQSMGLQKSQTQLSNNNSNIYVCRYSVAQSCLTLCSPMDRSTPGFPSFTISQSLHKLKSIESVMPSNHLILCCLLLLLPSIFLSIRVFSNEPALHIRCPKYWSFSISLSNEYSGLISFRI